MPGPSIEIVTPVAFAISQVTWTEPAESFVQSSCLGVTNDTITGSGVTLAPGLGSPGSSVGSDDAPGSSVAAADGAPVSRPVGATLVAGPSVAGASVPPGPVGVPVGADESHAAKSSATQAPAAASRPSGLTVPSPQRPGRPGPAS